MIVTLLDDVDDVPRTATVLAQRDGRVLVRVTRDVGMPHVYWQAASRVLPASPAGDGAGS